MGQRKEAGLAWRVLRFRCEGDSGTATITPGLVLLDVHYSTGKSLHLSLPAPLASSREFETYGVGCKAFFSANDRYLVVAFNVGGYLGSSLTPPKAVHIVVADVAARRVTADFSVRPEGVLRSALNLAGFLRDQANLVVLGSGPRQAQDAYWWVVLSVLGKPVQGPEVRVFPKPKRLTRGSLVPDAKHNRMWLYCDSPQGRHNAILSAPLIGPGPAVRAIEEPEDVERFILHAYPDKNTVIAVTAGNEPIVAKRIGVGEGKSEQIELPDAPGNLTDVFSALTSPDGRVVAVVRQLSAASFIWGSVEKGYDVDFTRVSPLEVVGRIHLGVGTDPSSISIDHRDGTVTVLSFHDGKWETSRLKVGLP